MVRAASTSRPTPRPDQAPGAPLLLASRSARRRSLLEQAGIAHVALEPGIDDGVLTPGRVPPEQWVASLAYLKAAAGLERHRGYSGQVLGADTVCIVDGELLGQPRDAADAGRMLRAFENRAHEVVTGVALLSTGRAGRRMHRRVFADRAIVRVGRLGPDRIAEYLASDRWRGKAGAYNLEERLAAGWPIECDGDPTTVVGLPMRRLVPLLLRSGVQVQPPGGQAA